MTIDEKNILWLDLFENLAYNKKSKLLEIAGRNKDIRKIFLTNDLIKQVVSQEEFNKMSLCLQDSFLDLKLKSYEQENIIPITFYNENYPYLLKQIPNPPFCLYCKGNIQLLNTFCIGVVGSRRTTDYGVVTTKQFTKDLVNADVTIVSGLASGVDTIAHKTAIEQSGKTIAVIAGGLHHIYPAINAGLARTITENNLIISENMPDVSPQSYLFPIRNRIIAGLSKGVLITEAGEKSGALYTIEYAIDYGREIFVVPGKINSEMSKGTNNLIKKYAGSIVLSSDNILEVFNLKTKEISKNSAVQLDIGVQLVLDYISAEKKTFQEILDYTKFSAKDLNTILQELELAGLVQKFPNNSYIQL